MLKFLVQATFSKSTMLVVTGLLMLIAGQVTPKDRLFYAGVPINSVIWLAVILILPLLVRSQSDGRYSLLACMSTIIATIVAWLVSANSYIYGWEKLLDYIVPSAACFFILSQALRLSESEKVFFKKCLGSLFLYLTFSLVYKLLNGFWDRQVLYGVSGAIVFGRIMAVGCIISLFAFDREEKGKRFFFFSVFLLAVLWSSSRGPLVALTLSLFLYFCFLSEKRKSLNLVVFLFCVTMAFFILMAVYPEGRLASFFGSIVNGESDFESLLGGRWVMYKDTLSYMTANPLGCGPGCWPEISDVNNLGHMYPHNLFLEVFSEYGLLLGFLIVLPLVSFVISKNKGFWVICFFLFSAQQVSGDLTDARYLLVFSLLAIANNRRLVRAHSL